MQNSDIVCDCNSVEVQDVLEYMKKTDRNGKSLEEILEDLKIGTRCECCVNEDCSRIDVHYSELIKN